MIVQLVGMLSFVDYSKGLVNCERRKMTEKSKNRSAKEKKNLEMELLQDSVTTPFVKHFTYA